MLQCCLFWMLPSAASAECMAQQSLTCSPFPSSRLTVSSHLPGTPSRAFWGLHLPTPPSPWPPFCPWGSWPCSARHSPRFRAGKSFFGFSFHFFVHFFWVFIACLGVSRRGQSLGAAQASWGGSSLSQKQRIQLSLVGGGEQTALQQFWAAWKTLNPGIQPDEKNLSLPSPFFDFLNFLNI